MSEREFKEYLKFQEELLALNSISLFERYERLKRKKCSARKPKPKK